MSYRDSVRLFSFVNERIFIFVFEQMKEVNLSEKIGTFVTHTIFDKDVWMIVSCAMILVKYEINQFVLVIGP